MPDRNFLENLFGPEKPVDKKNENCAFCEIYVTKFAQIMTFVLL